MIRIQHVNGYIELRDGANGRLLLRAYKSPNATRWQDMRFADKLRRLYRAYYLRISMDNCLDFFNVSVERRK